MIDVAEAERHGFPVKHTAAQIERPLDAPIAWVPQKTTGGGPASGYERETQIRGAFKVEAYEYRSLDPARCDGTRCKIAGDADTDQAPCPQHYILMHVSGQLETLDGAILASFPKQVTTMRKVGQTDDIVIAAAADLSEARGSLVLDPTIPPPRKGTLSLSIQFADSQRRGYGVLSVAVAPDLDDQAGPGFPSPSATYVPVQAQWGEPPTGRPSVTRP